MERPTLQYENSEEPCHRVPAYLHVSLIFFSSASIHGLFYTLLTMASSPTSAAVPAPPGVTSNFNWPMNEQRVAFLIGNIVCLVVPTVLVFFRVYIKTYVIKDLRWADCAFFTIPILRISH